MVIDFVFYSMIRKIIYSTYNYVPHFVLLLSSHLKYVAMVCCDLVCECCVVPTSVLTSLPLGEREAEEAVGEPITGMLYRKLSHIYSQTVRSL